ncbi:MAG: serine/threonine-protein kinase [Polyangiales bacterium]
MATRTHPDPIGDYEIVRELGSGGFGTVYEARKRRLDLRVALKLLHPHMLKDPEVVERFVREARAATRFRHPHIVTVSDVGEVDGVRFIEMELLDGESLRDRVDRGALPLVEALDALVPVFAAVAEVHDEGVVHRDIKPANIFLTAPLPGVLHPKLLDFGIAKLRDAARDVTDTDAFLGSVAYMSPEQMHSARNADARSDQWSLAVTAYECLTGRLPFEAQSVPEAVTAVLAGEFPAPRSLVPSLPEGVDAALRRALDRDPSLRFPSVRGFGAALLPFASARVRETYAGSLGAASRPAPEAPAPPSPPRRALAIALTLATVGALVAAFALRDDGTPPPAARVPPAAPTTALPAAIAAPETVASAVPEAPRVAPPDARPATVEARPALPSRRPSRTTRSERARGAADAGVAVGTRGVGIL